MRSYKTKVTQDAIVKDIDSKTGIVTGYLSTFGSVDSDNDMIMPGAFKKSIDERGPVSDRPRIKHLLFHDTTKLIGKFMDLAEDNRGLFFRSQLSRTTLGRDALMMYEDGLITEHSIGFNIIKADNEDDFQRIQEVKLWEGSAVTWGANEDTPVIGIKSLTKETAVDKLDKLTKALRAGHYTDETFDLLEIHLEQIKTYIYSLNEDKEPEQKSTPKPVQPDSVDLVNIIRNQIKLQK